ncbi:protease [Pseudoclavibacter endophyticus]|uniref:DJ-1/PfpI family protein n=1 Tax=Pseudoclavibacter endophyticus TaxID=1778590 RepID=A0A6H9WEY5_9MICO|nr:DJ-1/PfpI family protein [Pseudoclavibacter endophyticus]KAB1649489.1 DJ-1/PfpI family protein [Pseudoclavibacter endophyticus]GGA62234.1 protease [Pseudoclavibacter endophyticus]
MSKVLILAGDFSETLEVFYPYERLREEGYEPVIAAPSKKRLQFVVHDFEGYDTFTEKLGHGWEADIALADVDPTEYVALVVPGGRAPEYLRNNPDVKRIVQHFFDADGPVAVTCHGPLILAQSGVLAGRTSSGFPEISADIEAGGGTYQNSEALVDGNLVSARAWNDNGPWFREFIRLLRERAPLNA